MTRYVVPAVVAVLVAGGAAVRAQQPPAPGPEHELLKKMAGTWDATLTYGGMASKGTCVYKMELGGLWLTSAFEGEFAGAKFSGRGLDSYDAGKKKYVGVWVDSMVTTPMFMEGTYDAAKKTLTMTGDGPSPDGKTARFKAVSTMPDPDTIDFKMFMGDGKEPGFTILYKRRK